MNQDKGSNTHEVDRFAVEIRDVIFPLVIDDAEDVVLRKAIADLRTRLLKDYNDLVEAIKFLDLLSGWYLQYRALRR